MATYLNNLQDDNNIPLADDDPQVIISDGDADSTSSYTNGSASPDPAHEHDGDQDDDDVAADQHDEKEEKARLISQVLELQNTLDDLSQRVDGVKEENLKLRSENQVLGQYIENLMSASSVFQSTTSPHVSKKK